MSKVKVTTAALGLLLAGGCVETGKPLVIMQAERVVSDVKGEKCSAPATSESPLSEGVLDVGLDRDYAYHLYPVVQNRLPSIQEAGFEHNEVELSNAKIEIETPEGLPITWPATCQPTFNQPLARRMAPANETVLTLEALRSCHAGVFRRLFETGMLAANVAERVVFRAKVTVEARHGSSTIESDPFRFNVRVCYGCLHSGFDKTEFDTYDFGRSAPNIVLLSCEKLAKDFVNPYKGNACAPAQDEGPILCCARNGDARQMLCPAPDGPEADTTP